MRNLIILILVLSFVSPAFASSYSKTLGKIENSLFGIEYSGQNDSSRLDRIEETVYGEKKSGSIKQRLSKLNEDISCNEMGCEIAPKRDTFEEPQERIVDNGGFFEEKEDPNIEYPAVNALEQKTFGKEYKNLDIKNRLANLEKKNFNKTYTDDLSTRVDRLKEKLNFSDNSTIAENYDNYDNYYSPKTQQYNYNNYSQDRIADNSYPDNFYPDNSYSNNYYSPKTVNRNIEDNYMDKQIADRDFRSKLNKIEKQVFKQSFSSDPVDNRLSRLESAVFNTNFSNDSNRTRLNRLKTATDAQKVAKKYDSNGLTQKMATAFQIGMMVLMVVAMIL